MKKFNTTSKAIALIIAGSILFSSCASTTLIDSVPTGADLYLDGEYVGVTPQPMTDTKLIGTCTTVRIEKENYRNYYGSICRTEEADPGAIIGGVFFFFPFFWAMKYKPSHFYKLQPLSGDKASVDQPKAGEATMNQGNAGEPTLDQLLNSESNEKSQKMSVEGKAIDADNDGVIKLDEGNEITPEEFEQQKADKPE